MKAEVVKGGRGQFDVLLGEELIASRQQAGLFQRLLGHHGFPDEEATVAALRARGLGGGTQKPGA